MALRPGPQAAGAAAESERKLVGACRVVAGCLRSGAGLQSVGPAVLAVALALAAACGGSPSGDAAPVEIVAVGAPVDESPEPEPDPADAADVADVGEAPVDESPDDEPDPASDGVAAVEAGPVPDADGDTEPSDDAVAEQGSPAEAEDAEVESEGAAESENEGAADENEDAAGSEHGSAAESEDEGAADGEDEGAAGSESGSGSADSGDEVVATPESGGAVGTGGAVGAGGTIGIGVPKPDPDGPRAPLTGELTNDSRLAQRRALAVKVGNSSPRSRPQAGLAAADIVFETLIEAGEGRLMAVFHTELPGRVGPVRSARSSDFDLLAGLSRPFLASSGANSTVLAEMRRAERAGTIVDVGGLRTFVPYSRDPARRSPFNLYFDSDSLIDSDGAALRGGPLETPVVPLLEYGSSNPAGIAGANGVTVTYHRPANNVVSHIWDAAVGGWVRIQDGDLMMTETGSGLREVAPVNVAVMWMTHRYAAADRESPLTQSYGTGEALVLTAGAVHDAVWERTEDRAGFRFVDTAGNPLSFSPGSTWLLIANSSRRFPVTGAAVLAAADGTRLLAEAREAAEVAIGTR